MLAVRVSQPENVQIHYLPLEIKHHSGGGFTLELSTTTSVCCSVTVDNLVGQLHFRNFYGSYDGLAIFFGTTLQTLFIPSIFD